MDLKDAGSQARFLIRDRDGRLPGLSGNVLTDAGIEIVLGRVQMPRMNSIMEPWVQTSRREVLDRTLIWNQTHSLQDLARVLAILELPPAASEDRKLPATAHAACTDPRTGRCHLPSRHRRNRLGGILYGYRRAA
jgi:putative transposase